jgi:adenylate kinase family enzyme
MPCIGCADASPGFFGVSRSGVAWRVGQRRTSVARSADPAFNQSVKKIAVLGVSGSGKTTLARRLSKALAIPHVELDSLVHQSGWTEAPTPLVRERVTDVLAREEGWVIDGNYNGKLGDLRLSIDEAADAVVWLDLPLPRVLYRLVGRVVVDLFTQRDLYNGNRQGLRNAFFRKDALVPFAVSAHFERRRTYPARFEELGLRVVRLRSPREVEAWLEDVTRPRTA